MRNIIILLGIFILFSFNQGSYITRYGKKIDKELKKVFKEEKIILTPFELPEEIYLGSDNAFYTIKVNEKNSGFANINRVNACRAGGCNRPGPLKTVGYDHFYYMAVFDLDFSILKVVVLDYQSEHGYEICSKSWLKQFIGSHDNKFSYNKNIDAISGATVSVNAIIDEMNVLTNSIKKIKEHKDK